MPHIVHRKFRAHAVAARNSAVAGSADGLGRCGSLTPRSNSPNLQFMVHGKQPIPSDFLEAVHRLVEANRLQCLWFMREDYLPESAPEADRVLAEIELHGDRQAWAEARTLRAWLSQSINTAS